MWYPREPRALTPQRHLFTRTHNPLVPKSQPAAILAPSAPAATLASLSEPCLPTAPPAHTLPSSLSTVQLLLSLSEPILDQATECKVGCQEDALQTARRFTTRIPVVRIDP